MKWCLKIIFIFLAAALHAQSSKKISCTDIAKAELEKKEKLSDFKPTPSGCTVIAGEFTYNVNGKPVTARISGDGIGKEFIKSLANSTPDSRIYIDVTYSCGSKTRSETYCYKIIK
jgi:hypothetical protein